MTGAGDLNITSADFSATALVDLAVTVGWEDCTKTLNPISGQETLSYAGSSNKTVVFVKRTQRYIQTHEGLVDLGDAICLAPTSLGFVKNDKLTFDSEVFIINDVKRRYADGEALFDSCFCLKVQD